MPGRGRLDEHRHHGHVAQVGDERDQPGREVPGTLVRPDRDPPVDPVGRVRWSLAHESAVADARWIEAIGRALVSAERRGSLV